MATNVCKKDTGRCASDCSVESKICEAISSPYGEDTDVELVTTPDSSRQPIQEMNKNAPSALESGLFPLSRDTEHEPP